MLSSTPFAYLGRLSFRDALKVEAQTVRQIQKGELGRLLGFESELAITLGRRAQDQDLEFSYSQLERKGVAVLRVDRGGLATLHNPGQLVLFPVVEVEGLGVRSWVKALAQVTLATLSEFNIQAHWDEQNPGLYTAKGKVASIGIRVRDGVSTHGVSINVCNNLADFSAIRTCGVRAATLDQVGGSATPESVFARWVRNFHAYPQLTR